MKNRTSYIIPLLIFVISFILRISLISKGPYSVDCFQLALNAEKTLHTLQLQMHLILGFPLTVILGSIFIFFVRVFNINDPVIAVNFMSVVFSSSSIFLFYFVLKKLFDEKAALFSCVLFSTSPIFLGISVYGKSHAPCIFFLFLSILLLLKYFQTRKGSFFIFAAISAGFMGASRIIDLVLMFFPLSYLLIFPVDQISHKNKIKNIPLRKKIKNLISFWAIAFPTVIFFYLPYVLSPSSRQHASSFSQYFRHGFTNNFMGILSSRLGVAIKFLSVNSTLLGLLLSLTGLIILSKKNQKNFFFLVLWISCPLLFYGNLHMTVTSRYFVLLVPALYVAEGFLLSLAYRKNLLLKAISLCLFFFLALSSFHFIYPTLKTRHDRAVLPEFARWISQKTEKNALIICADESSMIKYYANRQTMGRPLDFFNYSKKELHLFKGTIESALNQNIPIYIHTGALYSYDSNAQFSNFLKQKFHLRYVGTCDYEDWHKGAMELQVYPFDLFKITNKKNFPDKKISSPYRINS